MERNIFNTSILKLALALSLVTSLSQAGSFPQISSTNDEEEMVSDYQPYLQFALEIGREVDASNAKRLATIYQKLKKHNAAGAALFLKGLRFEMIQKAELMGHSPARITNRTPEYRRFVAKYLREWVREADEHLFRAYSAQLARRDE